MKGKRFVLIICLSVAFGLSFLNLNVVKAAENFSAWLSASTIYADQSVTVTYGGSNTIGSVSISASNGTVGSYNDWIEENTQSVTVRPNSVGKMYITVTIVNPSDSMGERYPTKTVNLTVNVISRSSGGGNSGGNSSGGWTPPSNNGVASNDDRSSDNSLSALSISKGTLDPSFSPDVTEYRVELASDVTEIELDATANDKKASVSGTGKKTLKAGDNVFEIVCTAENESKKNYKITVHVDEKPLVFTSYKGKKLGFVRNLDGLKVPAGFETTTLKIDGKEVTAWKNEAIKQTLVYLVNEKTNEKSFYLYDEKKGVTSIYRQVKLAGRDLVSVDVPKNLQEQAGLVYQKFTIDEVEFEGWVYEDKAMKDFYLIYLMGADGDAQIYQYDCIEKTIQRYDGNVASEKEVSKLEKACSTLSLQRNILIGTSVIAIIAAVGLAFVYVKGKK